MRGDSFTSVDSEGGENCVFCFFFSTNNVMFGCSFGVGVSFFFLFSMAKIIFYF